MIYHPSPSPPTEQLVPGESAGPKGTYEGDMDQMIPPVLEEKKPCYIFYRLDERNAHGNYLWVFMSYTPDFAPVSQKGGLQSFE